MLGIRDVTLKDDKPEALFLDKHVAYLRRYADENETEPEQIMAESLKMSGMYWCLNALHIMKRLNLDSPEVRNILDFICRCQNEDGGFSAAPQHDSHILYTLSAIQVLVLLDKCNPEYFDRNKCVEYISSLQQPDGSFFGDIWGEVDSRFSLCGLAALKLLERLDAINIDKATEYILSCNNEIDGGFGPKPGSESHTAYVFCCVGSLAIAQQLHRINLDQLGWWLSQRQLPSGGLNGRPEKLPDVCYSWWCLSSLKMINKMHLIDHERLVKFILACQDPEAGGFSDRPGNMVDPFHTNFGLAALSLIGYHRKDDMAMMLTPVNPVLCMPEDKLISDMRPIG